MKRGLFLIFSFLFVLSTHADAKDPWVGYAAGGYNGKILVFELPSLNLLKEVPAGVDLRGPVLSGNKGGNSNGTPDGKMLYAVDKAANKVVFFDLASGKVSKTVDLPAGFGPGNLDISPDGKSLCVAGELSGKIAKVDTASGKVEPLAVGKNPAAPAFAAITRDGKTCLVSDYTNNVIWVASMNPFKIEKSVPSGGDNPFGIATTPDGKWALISNQFSANMAFLDIASMKVTKSLKTAAVPIHAVVDSKGQFAYQSAFLGSVVKKIDLAKQEVVDTFAVKSRPGNLGLSPDDKLLFVLNKYSTGQFEAVKAKVGPGGVNPTNIQVIDTASGKTVSHKPVLGEPFGLAVAAAAVIKDGSLGAGKPAVVAGREIDLPAKKNVKVSYGPAKPHKPGVFDGAAGQEVYLNAFSHQFAPNEVNVYKGETIKVVLQNIDEKGAMIDNPDVVHGFTINGYPDQTQVLLPRGVAATIEFAPDKAGTFHFYCSNFCGSVHTEMRGRFIVE
ncbi:MAG: beta-propeller fold lactonase family protein [Nitrospirota bacterium]